MVQPLAGQLTRQDEIDPEEQKMPKRYEPIGTGTIAWLGVNKERGQFSTPVQKVMINAVGIVGDMYATEWRKLASHDVDYIATDGVAKGEEHRNLRPITITDAQELLEASTDIGHPIAPGMLRENMIVRFTPSAKYAGVSFSKLPPLSRIVIGEEPKKVLYTTEENAPCRTIAQPMSLAMGDTELAELIRESLRGRRGQMVAVRSRANKVVTLGDTFKILPHMGTGHYEKC